MRREVAAEEEGEGDLEEEEGVVGIAAAGLLECEIEVVAASGALAHPVGGRATEMRPEAAVLEAVDGDVEETRVGVEGVLAALSMVHVPVHKQHSFRQTCNQERLLNRLKALRLIPWLRDRLTYVGRQTPFFRGVWKTESVFILRRREG